MEPDPSTTADGPVGFRLRYGDGFVDVSIPRENFNFAIEPPAVEPMPNVPSALKSCVENPIESPPLRDLIRPDDRVTIVVSDITRLTVRSDIMVPFLIDELESYGAKMDNITVVVAVGGHRGQTPEERARIVGPETIGRVRVVDHNARDIENHVYLGETSRGTPIWVNRLVAEADKVILTGGIDIHTLAGFGGGRKSICPGVSYSETIFANHRLCLGPDANTVLNPNVDIMKLEGNPLSDDMDEIASFVNPTFLLNTIVDPQARIVDLVAGHWREAFKIGCRKLASLFTIPVREKSDVVVVSCGGFPKDISIYQSVKALANAATVTKDDGAIVLVSESRDGPGSDGFSRWVELSGAAAIREALLEEFAFSGCVALRLMKTTMSNTVYVVSSLSEDWASRMRMIKVSSVEEAIQHRMTQKGKDLKIAVLPFGKVSVPLIV